MSKEIINPEWQVVMRSGSRHFVPESVANKIHDLFNSSAPVKLMAISPGVSINLVDIVELLDPKASAEALAAKGLTRCKYGTTHKIEDRCYCGQTEASTKAIADIFGVPDGAAVLPESERQLNLIKLRDLKNSIRKKHGWPTRDY